MGSTTFILICAAEAMAVLLFIIVALILKLRKLQRIMNKLKERAKDMREKLKSATSTPTEPINLSQPVDSYRDKLTQQLEITRNYHYQQGSRQDISLDLDPDSPLPRRTAALRNAFLVAEKEASSDATEEINWDFLATRYQQLLAFNHDYASDNDTDNQHNEIEQLTEELEQNKKRIKNLERFKSMYFDLEERWNKCKTEADTYLSELKIIAANSNQQESLDKALENYQASYLEIGRMIETGANSAIEIHSTHTDGQFQELSRLRSVAADQHRIITELQDQLNKSTDTEEQLEILDAMQGELKKQARFLQESETCIQLMDNELSNANKELELLRVRAKEAPQLKAALKELQSSAGIQEQIAESLKHENRRLAKKLKIALESPNGDNKEAQQLRKELATMQANYNDLEERFLDLKAQG